MASIKLGPNGELTEDTQIQFTLEERIYQMRSEIERLREVLRKIACDDDTCDCRAFNSHDAMCELGFARAALEGKK